MMIWITGGAGSGKSSLAQELAAALSRNGSKYYIATMVPRDEEDQRRIRRHILDRSGMGFETIECPSGLTDPSRGIAPDPDGTYLMDSATAMLSNAMFGEREFVYDPDAAAAVLADLAAFVEQVENFIAVSDGIYSDAMHYDGMTETYRRGLAQIEREMASVCDTVIECAAGGVIVHKGALPAELGAGCGENNRAQLAELSADRREYNGVLQKTEEKKGLKLIIGGACQGKTEYARTQPGISEEEIFTCEEDSDLDLQARCLDHFEQYLRGCVKQGKTPVSPQSLRSDAVIICEDITCGIVPIDPIDRRWRELTGRYLQKIAGTGAEVIRMVCGIPQVLVNPAQKRQETRKEILLLRHGMTEANEKHLYCGRLDWPLSSAGREALRRKTSEADRLYGEWDAYYTSGMKRTDETLQILFGEEAEKARKACPGLREMDFGVFEGKSYEELKEEPAYQEWISGDNEKNLCPGGGSGRQMQADVLEAFDRILREESADRIAVVTHGGPIAAIMQALFPEEDRSRYEWQPSYGEGYMLRISLQSKQEHSAESSSEGPAESPQNGFKDMEASYIAFPAANRE